VVTLRPFRRRFAGRLLLPLLLLAALAAQPQPDFYVYVGDVQPTSAIVAWGTTAGDNTIGRQSPSHGAAVVRIAGRDVAAEGKNWVRVDDLAPDSGYPYEVELNGRRIGGGSLRTWPQKSDKLAFFVIGDYGSGTDAQRRIAGAMVKTLEERRAGGNPVRFVLTTGDNIYANTFLGIAVSSTGSRDRDWQAKFFGPYERLLREIPFYPTLGNHDGNESESAGDLAAYLDNFFFPGGEPARYYKFGFGGTVDFFALDTTTNTAEGPTAPQYLKDGPQFAWLLKALRESRAPWKIAYFHHPPFSGGPRHDPVLSKTPHIVDALGEAGVRVVFNGHEHNFQFSHVNEKTRGALYLVTGAGGELRGENIRRNMEDANIEGWAAQRHFLLVEIEGAVMRIHPLADEPVRVRNRDGRALRMPLTVTYDPAAVKPSR
jgi:hypothetical protein